MEQSMVVERTPLHYVKIFFRRKRYFLIPVFIGLACGITAGFLLPKTYESSTIILVEEGKIINPLIQGLAVSTSLPDRLRTLREQILGWDRLDRLVKTLGLSKGIASQYQYEQLILLLRRNIQVQFRGPNLIRIGYESSDPAKTQQVVKTVTDIFIEENIAMQNRETDTAVEFINDQLKVYKRKIKESELAQKEDELKALLVDSTELHPRVKELRAEIAKIHEEIETGNFEVKVKPQPSSPFVTQIQQEISRIQSTTTATETTVTETAPSNVRGMPNENLYGLLLLDGVSNVLARDIQVNEQIYNMLLQRLETAKITRRLEASQEGTRYTILDPARLPLRPVKPNVVVTALIGFVLGAVFGTGIVLSIEFFDRSFLSVDEAKNFLSGPVLGAISKITTERELEEERKKRRLLGLPAFASACTSFVVDTVAAIRGR